MRRPILLTLVALGAAGIAGSHGLDAPPLRFKEERLTLEYTATSGEAAILLSAESETPLRHVEVVDPRGRKLIQLQADSESGIALSGLELETAEFSSRRELQLYAAGDYELRGRSAAGRPVLGKASLVHGLPSPATVRYPHVDEVDVSTELVVSWDADPEAEGYVVVLEQGENDGLTVRLPAGQTTFEVPRGVLQPKTESHVEVGIIGANGNCTLIEVPFVTR